MAPLDFFQQVVVALPHALSAANKPSYPIPALTPLAIKSAVLDGKEIRSFAIISYGPVAFVKEPLVQIEVEIAAGTERTSNGPGNLSQLGAVGQVVDYAPLRAHEI